jgi:hypothetical protein
VEIDLWQMSLGCWSAGIFVSPCFTKLSRQPARLAADPARKLMAGIKIPSGGCLSGLPEYRFRLLSHFARARVCMARGINMLRVIFCPRRRGERGTKQELMVRYEQSWEHEPLLKELRS